MPQRGQTLRAGAPSFQAPARWLRLFIFDFFFFGTATAVSTISNGLRQVIGRFPRREPPVVELLRIVEPKALERRPARIGHHAIAVARRRVAIDPALRADSGAVGPAQRVFGQVEHDVLAHHRVEIDLVADDRDGFLVAWVVLEQLVDDRLGHALEIDQAAPALTVPRGEDGAVDDDPVDARCGQEVDGDVAGNPFVVDPQLGRGQRCLDSGASNRRAGAGRRR